jgi:quercetin dioxygenase-like cupin family protein
MHIYRFADAAGRAVDAHGSSGATVVHLLSRESLHAVAITLEPGGLLGMHPAAAGQLFLVVGGGGQVAVAGEAARAVAPGTAVFWARGEVHETRAGPEGLVAIVLEGDDLEQVLAPQLIGQKRRS